MMTTLIILTIASIVITLVGALYNEDITLLFGSLLLAFSIFIGWGLIGNTVSVKHDITYITLKSIKDSSTYNSIVVYKDQAIKDNSYILFTQDSMTIEEKLSYNMYGILLNTSYTPIIK